MRLPLPLLVMELSLASWETMARRAQLIASGACTAAEYQRMVLEKLAAGQASNAALSRGGADLAALLTPWHSRATANALRLRKRRR